MINKKKIIWKVNLVSIFMASVRYRCLLPAIALKSYGYESIILHRNETVDFFDNVEAVVFVKTFSEADFALAKKANEHGVPIYIDLCDNTFIPHYINSPTYKYFKKIAGLASKVVTTGDALSEVIAKNLKSNIPVVIIPDQVEEDKGVKFLTDEVKLVRKSRFKLMAGTFKPVINRILYGALNDVIRPAKSKFVLTQNFLIGKLHKRGVYISSKEGALKTGKTVTYQKELPPEYLKSQAKTVIWFGNAGKDFSDFGLSTLAGILNELITINKIIPIKLLVVSNNIECYYNLIEKVPLITAYKPWNYNQIFSDIVSADVFIAPNSNDEFSICKSPNRALLALSLGTPVVATSMPSLSKITGCIIVDDWQHGLRTYLTDKQRVAADISAAKQLLEKTYSGNAIAALWMNVFNS